MADIQVTHSSGTALSVVYRPNVGVSASKRYYFYVRNTVYELWVAKTTDGGATWGSEVQINTTFAGVTLDNATLWCDWDTPGDSGTKVHCGWMIRDAVPNAEFRYRSFDTAGDVVGTEVSVVVTGQFGGGPSPLYTGIVKTRGGNLYMVCRTAADFDDRLLRSVDGGTTWTARAVPPNNGAPTRRPCLLPGAEADSNDFYMVNTSGNNINLNWYDDDLDSWTTTLIEDVTAIGSATFEINGACRLSDFNSFVVCPIDLTAPAGYAVRCWQITGGTTFTVRTDVYADDAAFDAAILYDNLNDAIYVAVHKSNGPGFGVVYKSSLDGALTWGSETRADADDVAGSTVSLQLTVNVGGGRMQPIWFAQTPVEFYAGSLAGGSVVIPPTSGASSNALAGRSFVLVFDAERQDTPFGRRG